MTNNKKRLGLAVPEMLYVKLKEKANYQGKTMNAMCLEIFWNYFEQKKEDMSEDNSGEE